WLAFSSFVQLTGGDVLALARARDRLLERLFDNGLRKEDLPGFLQSSGQPSSQRFRAVRQWMTGLCDLAEAWSKDRYREAGNDVSATHAARTTEAYIRLIFAYGLARMGEPDASRRLLDAARKVLGAEDEVHQALLRAYVYRIAM